MRQIRCGVVTGTVLGAAFIEGLRTKLSTLEHPAQLSLLMALHPSHMPTTVGYADVLHLHGEAFQRAEYVVSSKSEAFESAILEAALDFLLVISFSQLISTRVLSEMTKMRQEGRYQIFEKACVGAHPTPLPVGRGRAPIPWTIIKGLKASALTTFILAAGADNGPVVERFPFRVSPEETATTLYERVIDLHRVAGGKMSGPLTQGRLVGLPQNEAEATVWSKRTPADSHISSSLSVQDICRRVRASQAPYPSAYVVAGGAPILISRASPVEAGADRVPGNVVRVGADYIDLQVSDGAVRLTLDTELAANLQLLARVRIP